MWESFPTDLLVEIFRRLGAGDVLRCAFACKLWRRAIISNASSLRPRPDCFNPNLLLGFFHQYRCNGIITDVRLRRAPGPFESALTVAAGDNTGDHCERLSSFFPAASSGGGIDHRLSPYSQLMSCRDGFVLLYNDDGNDLCLCNPMTGDCTFLPGVRHEADTYVLVTGYDDNDDLGIRVVAVTVLENCLTVLTVRSQVLEGGSWGPVRCSPDMKMHAFSFYMYPGTEVVCRGAIHWLGESRTTLDYAPHMGILAVDVRTGRTWMLEVLEQCRQMGCWHGGVCLATTGDCQLSVVKQSRLDNGIHVWVLIDGDRWMLQRTIRVPSQYWMNAAFCPRSGYLLVCVNKDKQQVLVHVKSGSPSGLIRFLYPNKNATCWECHHPYEMDWSTYLSKMKLL